MRRGEEGIKDNLIKTIIENNKYYNDPTVRDHLASGKLASMNESQLRDYVNVFFDDVRRGWLRHLDFNNLQPNQPITQQLETAAANEAPSQPVSGTSQRTSPSGGTNTPQRTRTSVDPLESPNRPDLGSPIERFLDRVSPELRENITSSLSVETNNETINQGGNLGRRERIHNFLNDFSETLGPIRDVIGFIEERRNERTARGLVDQSMRNRPATPSVRGENRILSNLIRESEIARSNPMGQIQPMIDQSNLAYQQDLMRAQNLSGGQAGVALGMGQAAALSRDDRARQAGQMAANVYDQGLNRTAGLVGQQIQDNSQRDFQNMRLFEHLDRRNQMEQQAAGQALAFSTSRRLQQRNNMWDSLLNSPAFDVDTYMNLTRSNLNNR